MTIENHNIDEARITILHVEDDLAHAEIVRRNLADFRISRLIHVEDGQMAMDYLLHKNGYEDPASSPRPDLILLDLHLPKVDGLEVLARIKANEQFKGIPTVVLTTSSDAADVLEAYRLGAASYMVKPVEFEKFTRLMESFGFYWLACNQY